MTQINHLLVVHLRNCDTFELLAKFSYQRIIRYQLIVGKTDIDKNSLPWKCWNEINRGILYLI